jgi:hypothetical protein
VTIYTCSYSEYKRHDQPGRIPVRASRGYPRFHLPYKERMAYLHEATPEFSWLKLPYEQFLTLFIGRLNQHGAKKISEKLAEITLNTGGSDPVLLCYEDLGNPANWCHRQLFADWWLTQTGEEVIELGRLYVPPTGGTQADATLFDDIAEGT